ncbi:hypothetical protein MJG53_002520 [Ovis ammon polii x Ovis aries]|uniref:Uncharacterized protein n=1 Tax=Ovis ammon polii x Ovis aries TaxID=2918886 RepID=A0ACB9VEL8_9CETA|nr:hypothetical protein MJG53_002520 [Ovis ammon polii x Ovis aries]
MQRGDSLPPATVEPGPGTAAHPLLAFPDAAKLHCRVELYQKVVILYAGHNLTGEEEEAEAKGQQEELTPSSRTCRCDGYHGCEHPGIGKNVIPVFHVVFGSWQALSGWCGPGKTRLSEEVLFLYQLSTRAPHQVPDPDWMDQGLLAEQGPLEEQSEVKNDQKNGLSDVADYSPREDCRGKTEAPGGRECVCVGNSLQSLRRSTLHTDHRYVTRMSVVMLVKHSAQHLECSV